ncbi:MAG: hypothetical protein ACK559_08410, partial [bacterium]
RPIQPAQCLRPDQQVREAKKAAKVLLEPADANHNAAHDHYDRRAYKKHTLSANEANQDQQLLEVVRFRTTAG